MIFSFLSRPYRLWGPLSLQRVKLPEPEVDQAILPFAEVKNDWIYNSTVPAFHGLGQGPPFRLPVCYCPEGISRSHDFTKYLSHGAEKLRPPFFWDVVALPRWVTGA